MLWTRRQDTSHKVGWLVAESVGWLTEQFHSLCRFHGKDGKQPPRRQGQSKPMLVCLQATCNAEDHMFANFAVLSVTKKNR